MSVEFDEKPIASTRPVQSEKWSLTALLVRSGIVRTEGGASVILIIIAVIAILLSAYIASKTSVEVEPPSRAEVIID